MIKRRDELAEEFKESSKVFKKARIEASSTNMIGQWRPVDEPDSWSCENGYQYF